jgi:hypothetical protein
MKTVYDVKKALDPDLYVNLVRDLQAEQRAKEDQQRAAYNRRKPRNKWHRLFPVCK